MKSYRARVSFLPVDEMKDFKSKNNRIKLITNESNYNSGEKKQQRLTNKHLNYTYKYLTPLDQPVPNDWLTIEENFVIFLVIKMPLMGIDFVISPETRLNDEHMVMCFNKEGVSKADMVRIVTDSASGNFLKSPCLDFVRVKAFRLEPLDAQPSNLMVDGERVEYGALQGEIMPGVARVLCGDIIQ